MWEKRDESNPTSSAGRSPGGSPSVTQIGKSLKLTADIQGSEDLYIDGEVIGRIELDGKNLTIGPNGRVQADVVAQSVTIQGLLDGTIRASDCIELRKTGTFHGNMVTARIIIEEGAVFRGSVDIVKPGQENSPRKAEKKPPAADSKPAADPKPGAVEAKPAAVEAIPAGDVRPVAGEVKPVAAEATSVPEQTKPAPAVAEGKPVTAEGKSNAKKSGAA